MASAAGRLTVATRVGSAYAAWVSRLHAALAAIAAAVLIAVVAVASSADWYFACTDEAGNQLGGMDCFNTSPKTESALAAWLGFDALAIIGGLAVATIIVIVAMWLWRWWHDARRPNGTPAAG